MKKIKDRIILGCVAGSVGSLIQNLFDEISRLMGISKRSYRATAAGVWLPSRREAGSLQGQILGMIKNQALGMLGGIQLVKILSKNGRDHWAWKGLFYGEAFGAIITGLLSAFAVNKMRPQKAPSVLSYCVTNMIYGLVTAGVIAKCGHDSLFDAKPENDYLKPTLPTSEQGSNEK